MTGTNKTTMHLTIITPDKDIFKGDIQKATFPGVDGSFQVMKDHAPLVSALQQGTIYYDDEKQAHTLDIEGGIVEVLHNRITVSITSDPQPS